VGVTALCPLTLDDPRKTSVPCARHGARKQPSVRRRATRRGRTAPRRSGSARRLARHVGGHVRRTPSGADPAKLAPTNAGPKISRDPGWPIPPGGRPQRRKSRGRAAGAVGARRSRGGVRPSCLPPWWRDASPSPSRSRTVASGRFPVRFVARRGHATPHSTGGESRCVVAAVAASLCDWIGVGGGGTGSWGMAGAGQRHGSFLPSAWRDPSTLPRRAYG
jgi:hypothetical protein